MFIASVIFAGRVIAGGESKMKIRKGTKKDFDEYYRMKVEECKEYSKIRGKKIEIPKKEQVKENFYKILEMKEGLFLVVEKEKQLIAYLQGLVYKNIWSNCGYVEQIFTDKRFRKKGTATNLIEYFKKALKKEKIHQILLSVNVKNKTAFRLYKKLGFEITKYEMKMKVK